MKKRTRCRILLPLLLFSMLAIRGLAATIKVGATASCNIGYVSNLQAAFWTISATDCMEFVTTPSAYSTSVTVRAKKATSVPVVVHCEYRWLESSPTDPRFTYSRSGYKDWTFFIEEDKPQPTQVSLQPNNMTLNIGESRSIGYRVIPSEADQSLSWSSNSGCVSVRSGWVTANYAGSATITATASNGISGYCYVTVNRILPTSVSLPSTASVKMRQTTTLIPTLSPSNATAIYTWRSSNTSVATVNNSGVVSGVSEGETTITVTTDNGYSASCKVTCWKPVPTSVSVSKSEMRVALNATGQLTYSVQPSDAIYTATWSSDNEKIATVSQSGVITPKAVGTTTVRVTTDNGKVATCKVEVWKPVPTKINLSETDIRLQAYGTKKITYTVEPSNAMYTAEWLSSNEKVATVTQDGVIEAKGEGTAYVSLRTDNGVEASCKVTVPPQPTAVKIEPATFELVAGQSKVLSYSLIPNNAATTSLTWRSSDITVATVDDKGKVTAKAEGSANISVETANGIVGYSKLTVYPVASEIAISKASLTLHIGDKEKLSYVVKPSNAVFTVVWKSSNNDVVAVDKNGEITAKAQGTAKVTVTTDNGHKDACEVSVYPSPSSVALDKTSLNLIVGQSDSLAYTVVPSNAFYTVSWSSDSPGVVSVKDGRLEAKKGGTTRVKIITDNGRIATCKVTVTPEPTAVSIKPSELELLRGRSSQLTYSFVPAKAATLSLKWRSSDADVAFVGQNGEVIALRPGHATLTATTRNGVIGKCEITVPMPSFRLFVWSKSGFKTGYLSTDKPQFTVEGDMVHFKTQHFAMDIHRDTLDKFTIEQVLPEHPQSITIPESVTLAYGLSEKLSVSLWPPNTSSGLKWFNDNPNVVSVSQDGVVNALMPGESNLTAQTDNGLHANCHIRVPKPYLRFYVWLRSGELHAYDLVDHPKVSLGETFVLNTDNQTVQYKGADVLRFTLQDEAIVDGVTKLEETESVEPRRGQLLLDRCESNKPVYIYDMAGRMVKTLVPGGDGQLNIDLSSLNTGTYIIKTNSTTFKIQTK